MDNQLKREPAAKVTDSEDIRIGQIISEGASGMDVQSSSRVSLGDAWVADAEFGVRFTDSEDFKVGSVIGNQVDQLLEVVRSKRGRIGSLYHMGDEVAAVLRFAEARIAELPSDFGDKAALYNEVSAAKDELNRRGPESPVLRKRLGAILGSFQRIAEGAAGSALASWLGPLIKTFAVLAGE